jgi:hypothetical protein
MATQLFEISRAISANALGLAFALTILFMVVAIFVPRSSLETGKGVAFSLAMVLHVLMVVIMLIAVAAYAVSSRWIYVLAPLAAVALSAKAINWILDKRENKGTDKTKNIRWCKNCIHHKPSPRYEDIIRGLWRAERMPRISELPCDIADKTSDVWQRYFLVRPNSRT